MNICEWSIEKSNNLIKKLDLLTYDSNRLNNIIKQSQQMHLCQKCYPKHQIENKTKVIKLLQIKIKQEIHKQQILTQKQVNMQNLTNVKKMYYQQKIKYLKCLKQKCQIIKDNYYQLRKKSLKQKNSNNTAPSRKNKTLSSLPTFKRPLNPITLLNRDTLIVGLHRLTGYNTRKILQQELQQSVIQKRKQTFHNKKQPFNPQQSRVIIQMPNDIQQKKSRISESMLKGICTQQSQQSYITDQIYDQFKQSPKQSKIMIKVNNKPPLDQQQINQFKCTPSNKKSSQRKLSINSNQKTHKQTQSSEQNYKIDNQPGKKYVENFQYPNQRFTPKNFPKNLQKNFPEINDIISYKQKILYDNLVKTKTRQQKFFVKK